MKPVAAALFTHSGERLSLRHLGGGCVPLGLVLLAACGSANESAAAPAPESSSAPAPVDPVGTPQTSAAASTTESAASTETHDQGESSSAPLSEPVTEPTQPSAEVSPLAPSSIPGVAPVSPVDPQFPHEGSAIPPGSGPLGTETLCNGEDDDSNGVIDDVDAQSDGVCDCLRVATLGLHGEWGQGDVVQGFIQSRLASTVGSLDAEPVTEEALSSYHVVLVRDVSSNHNPGLSFSETEVTALWNWVRSGGGLMTFIGYSDSTEVVNVNRLLSPFGLSYGSEAIVPGEGQAAPVTEWFEHPLTLGVSRVGADNGYPVLGQGVTVAAEGGYDLGKAITIGDGHVLVWGDEWVTYQDEWQNDTTYQVEQFWKNALLWLSRVNVCQLPRQ